MCTNSSEKWSGNSNDLIPYLTRKMIRVIENPDHSHSLRQQAITLLAKCHGLVVVPIQDVPLFDRLKEFSDLEEFNPNQLN